MAKLEVVPYYIAATTTTGNTAIIDVFIWAVRDLDLVTLKYESQTSWLREQCTCELDPAAVRSIHLHACVFSSRL